MNHRSRLFRPGTTLVGGLILCLALVSGCSAHDSAAPRGHSEADVSGELPGKIPGTVRVGMSAALTTIDPDRAVQDVDVMSLALVSGTLLRSTSKGIQPGLAESCEASSAGLVYVCTLRKGLRFSDGTAITGNDVVASFQRALTDTANANAGLISTLKKVEADGADAVRFTLAEPTTSFLLALTEGPLGIFPADKINTPGFFTQPVSSGPYRLAEHSSDGSTFERNPYYIPELKPVVETVEFDVVVDPSTRQLQLATGQLNIAHELPPNLASQVKRPAQAYATGQYGAVYIFMNNNSGPLREVNVRRAISTAVDREAINQIAYLGQNKPLASFLPTVMEGHDPDVSVERDVAKARDLLKGTECEQGCKLTIMQRAGRVPFDSIATVIQRNLAEVGIDVSIQTVDQATGNANEQNGNYQMEVGSLYDVVNSPELIMLNYGLTKAGGINSLFSYYDSAEMNRLVAQLAATSGKSERASLLEKINSTFDQDLPYVPLVDQANVWASNISPRIMSFTPNGVYQVGTESAGPGA
ncbi:ABC transporter substrate-binding protein [Nocardioides ginsengisoli]|uniref:ABC transporter substrate-binding protein n=1 Tax=Nocardioides ginsengisoli TaxID=363868 RepID=A0ABW3W528_9ACTN